MSESRPKNIPYMYYIRIAGDGPPIGTMAGFSYHPQSGWQLCNGMRFSVGEWPDLYAVVGDTVCPKETVTYLPRPLWQKGLMRLGFYFRPRTVKKPNPDYLPGFFRIPNMPGPT